MQDNIGTSFPLSWAIVLLKAGMVGAFIRIYAIPLRSNMHTFCTVQNIREIIDFGLFSLSRGLENVPRELLLRVHQHEDLYHFSISILSIFGFFLYRAVLR
jgi:hypothetical protein